MHRPYIPITFLSRIYPVYIPFQSIFSSVNLFLSPSPLAKSYHLRMHRSVVLFSTKFCKALTVSFFGIYEDLETTKLRVCAKCAFGSSFTKVSMRFETVTNQHLKFHFIKCQVFHYSVSHCKR